MKYDLGQEYGPCAPMCADGDNNEKKIQYPSLYFTHDEKIDLPDEGTAVITFRKIESSENTRDPEDPKYRCELEVRTLEVKGGAAKNKGMVSVGDALKKAMKKAMDSEDESPEEDYAEGEEE